MIVHEPASTEAPEAEDIPGVDPTAAEDIGHNDNVEDDEVLPQIKQNLVSSPVLTNSELISIGRPLTPIAQDASWANRPQEEEDFEAHPTPTPQASPALRRIRKDQGLQSLSLKLKLLKTFRLHQPMKKKPQELLHPRLTKKLFSRRT